MTKVFRFILNVIVRGFHLLHIDLVVKKQSLTLAQKKARRKERK